MKKYKYHTLGYAALTAGALVLCLGAAFPALADDTASTTASTTEAAPAVIAAPQATSTDGTVGSDATTTQGDTVVSSGDATAGADIQNNANTNDTQTPDASSTVADTNVATTTNDAQVEAQSGGNTASGGGSAFVTTGDAIATANVINVVNTNIINSNGLLLFLNALFGGSLNFDTSLITSLFSGGSAPASACSLSSCGDSLNVFNSNTATVTNEVIVRANSGGNTATSTDGSASVNTGDAFASANVVNVVNTNLINSNYLLVAVNNFGNLAGDITLPSAAFFNQLFNQQNGGLGSSTIENTNTATVTNNATSSAQSGGNTASGGDASVSTGSALSGSTAVNMVNTNLTGGTTLYLLVNVLGDWSGTVQGLPQGMSWVRTPTGILLQGGSLADLSQSQAPQNPASTALTSLMAKNDNTASVDNNVQVFALTGENEASGGTGSSVTTGTAAASANVVNVVNTNVIGQNWILAIFNIFGDWKGNFAFGHPNLWIGGVAETQNPTPPGSSVTYHFTVSNKGDADATNAVLHASFDKNLLSFSNVDASADDGALWDLGTIPVGATEEFTYTATAGDTWGPVPLAATVTSDETDADLTDNTENLSIIIGVPKTYEGNAPRGKNTRDPEITMQKKVDAPSVSAPGTAHYSVVIDNTDDAGPAYNTTLTDTLTAPDGSVVYTRSWDLDTINPGDEIDLDYDVSFGTTTKPGIYTSTARLTGQRGNSAWQYAYDMTPVQATSTLTVNAGLVLGAETSLPSAALACGPFLTSYILPGARNNSAQVKLLQYFLHTFESAGAVSQTGVYDAATQAAVKAFQEKYASDVLYPWGLTDPSGSVYYLTQQKINELYCQGRSIFPLSTLQTQEIQTFKNAQNSLFKLGF